MARPTMSRGVMVGPYARAFSYGGHLFMPPSAYNRMAYPWYRPAVRGLRDFIGGGGGGETSGDTSGGDSGAGGGAAGGGGD